MTVQDAIDVREKALSLGLGGCCVECDEALSRLSKLGRTDNFVMRANIDPTQATIGHGMENAVRYLRRKIRTMEVRT